MAKSSSNITAIIIASLLVLTAFTRATEPICDEVQQPRQPQPEAYQERLVEWLLEDPDGFFHPSILWQRLGSDGTTGPYAMHATDNIPKGTPLIVLPRKYVLESNIVSEISEDEYWDHYTTDSRLCVTVEKMLEYFYHVDSNTTFQSFYAPYLSYLFEDTAGGTMRGLLPTSWSNHSKAILDLILEVDEEGFHHLAPDNYEHQSIFDICGLNGDLEGNDEFDVDDGNGYDYEEKDEDRDLDKEVDDEDDEDYFNGDVDADSLPLITGAQRVERTLSSNNGDDVPLLTQQHVQDAYLFLLSRGWFDKLLPIIDMVNHRNGPSRNVEITPIDDQDGNDVAIYAWRDITKGEQLTYTYSECFDETCGFGSMRYGFTTPEIFKDFGFVELYPQRWILYAYDEKGREHQKLVVEVTTDDDDESKKVFKWIFETPDDISIQWMRERLAYLNSIESRVKEGLDQIELRLLQKEGRTTINNLEHERDSILELYEAYVQVFELALEHQNDSVAITLEDYYEELEQLQESEEQQTIHDLRKHELLVAQSSKVS